MERALVRFGLSWNFWPKVVQVVSVEEKKYESNWTDLGQWKVWLSGNVPLDVNWGMKKVTLCNHGQ